MGLRLGVARRDASPAHPVQLAGFGRRAGALVSQFAHPIQVRVAVIGDDTGTLALVSGEFLNWSTESDERFRTIVAEQTGVAPSDILFSATHTHSAPQLSHHQAALLGVVDEGYLDELAAHLAIVAREAAGSRREVTVARVAARHELAWQRRQDLDADPRIDDTLTVVRFDAGDELVACFVHYACHPVVSADNVVSGDFFGAAMAGLERATGAVAFPLQGCAGDVDPGGAVMAGIERAAQVGRDFADAVAGLLAEPSAPVATGPISAAWRTAQLPVSRVPTPSELGAVGADDPLEAQWAAGLLAHPDLLRPELPCRLQLWSLGPGLQLLAMSGEVTSPYGLRIRERSGGRALPVAYSNGMVGYIPTAAQIAAGGYEVHESARCYLIPGTFDPVIEVRMNESVDALLEHVPD
ncbi:MAG TPA: hypothetical protein VNR36_11345 [Pseudolysinimonas sp.]|nr:hypothetical protein [Pseudolysinimonas sp.]